MVSTNKIDWEEKAKECLVVYSKIEHRKIADALREAYNEGLEKGLQVGEEMVRETASNLKVRGFDPSNFDYKAAIHKAKDGETTNDVS